MFAAIDWQAAFFWLFALISCGFALAVLFTPNIVHMASYLIVSLGAVAGLFFLAGAEFVGAMQLMLYVGGTLVLLVFGVMLTSRSNFIRMKTGGGEWILTLFVGGALLLLLLRTAFLVDGWRIPLGQASPPADASTTTRIGLALSGVRLDGGNGYLLPFVIISMHLLVVLIGAAYLARAKRSADGGQPVDRNLMR
ncbi:MAG: hypothetical protein GX575_00700 [Candidatus Anammoximicrobium sp.]|nr:hypothetical protein [Candidatus Anammoximicrobium sp.]